MCSKPRKTVSSVLYVPVVVFQSPLCTCSLNKNWPKLTIGQYDIFLITSIPSYNLGSGYFAVDGNLPSKTILP